MQQLILAAQAQLKRAQILGRSVDERVKAKRDAADDWIPDEDVRRDFAAINAAIQHCGGALIKGLEGNKKNLGGMTEAQLEAQLAAELVRSAQTLTEEQWQAMVRARKTKDDE